MVVRQLLGIILIIISLSITAQADPVDDGMDLSDELLIVKPNEPSQQGPVEETEIKINFNEDEKEIVQKRAKLVALGAETLRATIFNDLKRYYLDDVSKTEIEYPLGPRFDLDKLNPDLEGKNEMQRKKARLSEYLLDKNLSSILEEFKDLNADQLADFIVRKEAWMKTVAEGLLKMHSKWKLGEKGNPITIERVNKFLRTMNNAFFTAPLNVAYSNTFGFQPPFLGWNAVAGASPGTIGEKYLGRFTVYNKSRERMSKLGTYIEYKVWMLQMLIEKRLDRPHLKPWFKMKKGEFGAYLSVGLSPAISFRKANGVTQIYLEFFSEVETFKTSLTPVIQAYIGETGGFFLEERIDPNQRQQKYSRRFIPLLAIYGKGESHMSMVGGTSIIPNIPALVQTNATRTYFARFPMNEAAREGYEPNKAEAFILGFRQMIGKACNRFFSAAQYNLH